MMFTDQVRRMAHSVSPDATIIHIHRYSSRKSRKALRVIESMSPMLVLHRCRGLGVAWLVNLIMLAGMTIRLPVWLIVDTICIPKWKRTSSKPIRGACRAYKGGLRPVWLPRKYNPKTVS